MYVLTQDSPICKIGMDLEHFELDVVERWIFDGSRAPAAARRR